MPTVDDLLDEVYGSPKARPAAPAAPAPAPAAASGAMTPEQADQAMSTPGGYFSQAIGGPVHDYFANFMAQAMGRSPVGQAIPDMAVPDTLTGAAVTAGTLLAPEAKAAQYFGSAARNMPAGAMLDRIMAPLGAGVLGGFAEKGDVQDAFKGGVLGLLTGVPAETASGISRWYAGSKLAQRFFKEDPQAMTSIIKKLVPEYGTTLDPADLGKAFWGTAAQDAISTAYDSRMTSIADRATRLAADQKLPGMDAQGGMKAFMALQPENPMITARGIVNSPRIGELKAQGVLPKGDLTVDDTLQAIRDLRLKGRTSGGDPKMTLDGRQARDYASEVSADLKDALDTLDPRLGKTYLKTDQKYAKGAEMIRYMKQPGVIDKDGRLNMGLLQDQLKEESRFGIEHIFTPDEVQQLTDTVFRGADPTVVDNILKPNIHATRIHMGPEGHPRVWGDLLSMFRNNKYAGNYDVDFLKPKGPQLLMQRLKASSFGGLDKPIGSANTLKSDSED